MQLYRAIAYLRASIDGASPLGPPPTAPLGPPSAAHLVFFESPSREVALMRLRTMLFVAWGVPPDQVVCSGVFDEHEQLRRVVGPAATGDARLLEVGADFGVAGHPRYACRERTQFFVAPPTLARLTRAQRRVEAARSPGDAMAPSALTALRLMAAHAEDMTPGAAATHGHLEDFRTEVIAEVLQTLDDLEAGLGTRLMRAMYPHAEAPGAGR